MPTSFPVAVGVRGGARSEAQGCRQAVRSPSGEVQGRKERQEEGGGRREKCLRADVSRRAAFRMSPGVVGSQAADDGGAAGESLRPSGLPAGKPRRRGLVARPGVTGPRGANMGTKAKSTRLEMGLRRCGGGACRAPVSTGCSASAPPCTPPTSRAPRGREPGLARREGSALAPGPQLPVIGHCLKSRELTCGRKCTRVREGPERLPHAPRGRRRRPAGEGRRLPRPASRGAGSVGGGTASQDGGPRGGGAFSDALVRLVSHRVPVRTSPTLPSCGRHTRVRTHTHRWLLLSLVSFLHSKTTLSCKDRFFPF